MHRISENRAGFGVRVMAAVFLCAFAFVVGLGVAPLRADSPGGAWDKSHYSKARLVGVRTGTGAGENVVGGVEIVLDKNWKTYWRQPGNAGGVPPSFDWSGSSNVASVEVAYPAPQRFRDFSGSTVGYKDSVVFPLRIVAERAGEPVELKLLLSYGLCSSICVPVQASLAYTIGTGVAKRIPALLANALLAVPRAGDAMVAGDPKLSGHRIVEQGERSQIVLDVDFGGQTSGGNVFVESTGGVYLPMAKPRPNLGPTSYGVDLSYIGGPGVVKGQILSVTIVSKSGHSVSQIKFD